jgi:hypothetical protein
MLLFWNAANYDLARSIDVVDEQTEILSGTGVKCYANENERLTHFAIYHGKRAEGSNSGDGEWANVTIAVNLETFDANYYGATEEDRLERKVETEWLPADYVPASIVEQGVTVGMALAIATRRVQYQAHAPTVFTWESDFREQWLRVGAVVTVRVSEWQDIHGESRPIACRIIKSVDDGMGTLKIEAQALGIEKRNATTGRMDSRGFAFIAPDHVATSFDTASAADRAFCYLTDASGTNGVALAPGYLIP